MSSLLYASRITGTGSAFPEKCMTNLDFPASLNTSADWIQERTGIYERRISNLENKNEHNSSLGVSASKKALEMAGKKPSDIDTILYCTCSPDTILPSSGCWLQTKLEANRAWAIDLNAACSGYVYGLAMADQLIRTGFSKTVLVVGAEVLSSFVNWQDRSSCILFGDGAGASLVEQIPADSPRKILSSHLKTEGALWELFHIPAGGSSEPVTPLHIEKNLNKMHMKGKEIFKVAVKTLSDFAIQALEANDLKPSELNWFIPHQANLRIIEAVAKRIGFPMEKVIVNIDRFANTSAATIPTALDEAVRSKKILPGQTVLMDVFGAGLTYGSLLLRW